METEESGAGDDSKPLLRSDVEAYCNMIVQGMKVRKSSMG